MATRSPASTAKAEAKKTVLTFEFKGKTYELNPDLDEVGLMEAFEQNRPVTAAKALVGEDVFNELRAAGKLRKGDDLSDLVNVATAAMGTNEGE